MVRNGTRKRARGSLESDEASMPPFWRSSTRLKRAHGNGAKESHRLGTSSAVSSLALIAHARLTARDFGGAARALAVLLTRYRRNSWSSWSFPREAVSIAGAVARRAGGPSGFLEYVANDESLSARAQPSIGGGNARAIALVEAALDEVAAGRIDNAHGILTNDDPAFERSFLVHLFHGLVSLALAAQGGHHRDTLLAEAGEALEKAAKLDPSEYICAHAAALVEIQRGDKNAAIQRYRSFGAHDAFAQAALLKALRSLPRTPHQEIVEAARALHEVDPMANDALSTLREACAWRWDVRPRVNRLEVANVAAAVVEHGGGNGRAWTTLADCLRDCEENELVSFWSGAGRDKWWPSHFFRVTRLNADRMVKGLANAKAEVATMLDANIPYGLLFPHTTQDSMC